jgi:hypothetical protein
VNRPRGEQEHRDWPALLRMLDRRGMDFPELKRPTIPQAPPMVRLMLLYAHREGRGQRHLQTTWASNSQFAVQLIDFS